MPHVAVEAMARARETAEQFLAELARLMGVHNVYRGRVLEVGGSGFGEASFEVRQLPRAERDGIVLPARVLERIERHTLTLRRASRPATGGRSARQAWPLAARRCGDGKTLTAMSLANRMPERTVLILTGGGLDAIGPGCDIARTLS